MADIRLNNSAQRALSFFNARFSISKDRSF